MSRSKTKLTRVRPGYRQVLADVAAMIDAARTTSARAVNTVMTATHWAIGRRIVETEQHGKPRAEYGAALIDRLAQDLTRRFGRGFGHRNLLQMRAFYLAYPEIPQTTSAQLVPLALGAKVQTPSALSGENPPVGLVLCAEKDAAVARYALDGLPNTVLAAEYHTVLPDERTLVAEIERTIQRIESRSRPAAERRRAPA